MFGHDDNNTGVANNDNQSQMAQPAISGSLPNGSLSTDDAMASQVDDIVSSQNQGSTPMLTNGSDTTTYAPNTNTMPAPAVPAVAPDSSVLAIGGGNASTDDLLNIKQQALQHLSPLVSHLDQTPEEKFRTTMMMIQASDNQDLIKTAYDAAQNITDEKARAQALLDIVNEINYFTQQQK